MNIIPERLRWWIAKHFLSSACNRHLTTEFVNRLSVSQAQNVTRIDPADQVGSIFGQNIAISLKEAASNLLARGCLKEQIHPDGLFLIENGLLKRADYFLAKKVLEQFASRGLSERSSEKVLLNLLDVVRNRFYRNGSEAEIYDKLVDIVLSRADLQKISLESLMALVETDFLREGDHERLAWRILRYPQLNALCRARVLKVCPRLETYFSDAPDPSLSVVGEGKQS